VGGDVERAAGNQMQPAAARCGLWPALIGPGLNKMFAQFDLTLDNTQ
jgi:hypothetical protein